MPYQWMGDGQTGNSGPPVVCPVVEGLKPAAELVHMMIRK